MFRPSAGACALALLSLSTGCRLDQGLQGKDGVVDGSIDSSPALDSDTDSGSDTSLPECAEFAPATTGAAAENLACGTRGAGNPEAWSAAVEFVYEAPEAATWHARGANVPALILRPRGDACSQGDGLACLFTATRDLSVAVYTAGLRTTFLEPPEAFVAQPASRSRVTKGGMCQRGWALRVETRRPSLISSTQMEARSTIT